MPDFLEHGTDLANLLSPLEESTFLRLFRFLADMLEGNHGSAVEPLDLPNSGLHLKAVAFMLAPSPSLTWCPEGSLNLIGKGTEGLLRLVDAPHVAFSQPRFAKS